MPLSSIRSASVVFSRILPPHRGLRGTPCTARGHSLRSDQAAQLLGIAEGSQRAVDQANDLAQPDFRSGAPQPVSALCAAHALHHARVLQFQKNQLEELFRQLLLIGDSRIRIAPWLWCRASMSSPSARTAPFGKSSFRIAPVCWIRPDSSDVFNNSIKSIEILEIFRNAKRPRRPALEGSTR